MEIYLPLKVVNYKPVCLQTLTNTQYRTHFIFDLSINKYDIITGESDHKKIESNSYSLIPSYVVNITTNECWVVG